MLVDELPRSLARKRSNADWRLCRRATQLARPRRAVRRPGHGPGIARRRSPLGEKGSRRATARPDRACPFRRRAVRPRWWPRWRPVTDGRRRTGCERSHPCCSPVSVRRRTGRRPRRSDVLRAASAGSSALRSNALKTWWASADNAAARGWAGYGETLLDSVQLQTLRGRLPAAAPSEGVGYRIGQGSRRRRGDAGQCLRRSNTCQELFNGRLRFAWYEVGVR
jgi:hypothetical protein